MFDTTIYIHLPSSICGAKTFLYNPVWIRSDLIFELLARLVDKVLLYILDCVD